MAKVLIADDLDDDVKTLVRLLEKNGHEVIRKIYSADAQRSIVEDKPDAAVYDGSLARFSDSFDTSSEWGGAFLARESRRKNPNMPCLVYTHGISNKEHVERIRALNVPIFIKRYEDFREMFRALGLPEMINE